MTMLLRTGVHIIGPKLPRALRICPITTWMPMKKMVGRQYCAKVIATSLECGLSAIFTDIARMSSGAAKTAMRTIPPRITETRVSSRFA